MCVCVVCVCVCMCSLIHCEFANVIEKQKNSNECVYMVCVHLWLCMSSNLFKMQSRTWPGRGRDDVEDGNSVKEENDEMEQR